MGDEAKNKALFPATWGWSKYEEAFREAAQREVQVRAAEAQVSACPVENEIAQRWAGYEGTKLLGWWDEQVVSGRLPDDDALIARLEGEASPTYRSGLDRALADAQSSSSAASDRNPPTGSLAPTNENTRSGRRR